MYMYEAPLLAYDIVLKSCFLLVLQMASFEKSIKLGSMGSWISKCLTSWEYLL